MSNAQDWAPVVLKKKAPSSGSTVTNVEAARAVGAARSALLPLTLLSLQARRAGAQVAAVKKSAWRRRRRDDSSAPLASSCLTPDASRSPASRGREQQRGRQRHVVQQGGQAGRRNGRLPQCASSPCAALLRSLAHAATVEKVSSELKTNLMKARLEKKLTQAQLAQQINELPKVVQDYEAGKAVPNPAIIGKLERALGVKLRPAKK